MNQVVLGATASIVVPIGRTARRRCLIWALALLTLLAGSKDAQSEVFFERQDTYDQSGRRYAVLLVLGTIKRGDEIDFARHLKIVERDKLRLIEDSVVLDSWGGNRWAAFDMGRLIRKNRLATLVRSGDQCDSACVWVLVGGVCRAAIGNVGIHRMQHADLLQDPGIEKSLSRHDNELKRYLLEMDVPLEMLQVANFTPSWGVTYLTDVRKRVWGLFSTLNGEQERRITTYARRTGLNKKDILQKLRQREREIYKSLGEDDDYRGVPCSEQLLLVDPQVAPEAADSSS